MLSTMSRATAKGGSEWIAPMRVRERMAMVGPERVTVREVCFIVTLM